MRPFLHRPECPILFNLPKNIYVISGVMALSFTIVSMMVLVTGLLGAAIAPDPKLATLPVAMLVVGTAIATIPAAFWMQKVGRKRGMATGICFAIIGCSLSLYAALIQSFYLLIAGMVCIGFNAAFTQQGRFIILENAQGEKQQADGLTLGLLANLFAAILGPWLGAYGRDLIASPVGFAGSFLLAITILSAGAVVLLLYKDVAPVRATTEIAGRPIRKIVAQPVFLLAMGSAAVGYCVMALVMTATPISMHQISGHSIDSTRFVIQSHIVAMFLPSLLSGYLVKKGLRTSLLLSGLGLYLLVVSIGFLGIEVLHYWWALVLLGLGWNLLFLTSTAMLPLSYTEPERFKTQALNDFVIFSAQAAASFAAGWLLFNLGWDSVLSIALGVSIIWIIAILVLQIYRLRLDQAPTNLRA